MEIQVLKQDLIKRIDRLNDDELQKVYHQLVEILESSDIYQLSDDENHAIDEALLIHEEQQLYTHEEVIADAKSRYPNLKFE